MKSYFHLQLHGWWVPLNGNQGNTTLSLSRRLHEHQIKFFSPKRHLHQEKGIMLSRASKDTDCADIQWYLLSCKLYCQGQYKNCPIFADDVSDTQTFFFFCSDWFGCSKNIVLLRSTAGLSMTMEKLLADVCWELGSKHVSPIDGGRAERGKCYKRNME